MSTLVVEGETTSIEKDEKDKRARQAEDEGIHDGRKVRVLLKNLSFEDVVM